MVPVRFHSSMLKPQHKLWSPCEIEGLALANAINTEYNILRESKHPILLLPDSKPVADAAALIKQGKFSTSARMNSFLTNVNKIPITVKHLSGKFNLNPIADHQSRHPPECSAETCSVHRFIDEASSTILDPANRCGAIYTDSSLSNRAAWLSAQGRNDACKAAVHHLTSGKVASNKPGDMFNEMRHYINNATLTKEGLLVVNPDNTTYKPGDPKDRVVIPHHIAPGLLYHLHNNKKFAEHPSMNQLKAMFNRRFYTWALQPLLETLYKNCYTCQITQKQHQVPIRSETKTEVNHPHRTFHADIIKRAGQLIMLLTDHFSSYTTAKLIHSEQAEDLKAALIELSSPVRYPGPITISTDEAPGFRSLVKQKDQQLADLDINLNPPDSLNKNYNAVVDKACQELEMELRKILPEGQKLNNIHLAKAVVSLNNKIRRAAKVSAYEIHTARNADTGMNINLDDKKLRKQQLDSRQTLVTSKENLKTDIRPGDTVTNITPQPKHNVRDMYMVTSKADNKVTLQRLLHPLAKSDTKFMSKEYTTDTKRLQLLHRPPKTDMKQYNETLHQPGHQRRTPQPVWTPTNRWFHRQRELSSDDDSDEEEVAPVNIIADIPGDIQVDIPADDQKGAPIEIPENNIIDIPIDIVADILPNIQEDQAVEDIPITPGNSSEEALMTLPPLDSSTDSRLNTSSSQPSPATHDVSVTVSSPDVAGPSTSPQPAQHTQLVPIENLNQDHKPRKNEVIFFLDIQSNSWVQARIKQSTYFKHYYNIRYLDKVREDGGVYLEPGKQWSYTMPDFTRTSSSSSESSEGELEIQTERARYRPGSRQISPVDDQNRQEHFVQPSRTLRLGESIQLGQVYRLPDMEAEEQVKEVTPRTEVVSDRVRRRAEKLRLQPEQEKMRINIAKALTLKKKESKACSFLNKLLRK